MSYIDQQQEIRTWKTKKNSVDGQNIQLDQVSK